MRRKRRRDNDISKFLSFSINDVDTRGAPHSSFKGKRLKRQSKKGNKVDRETRDIMLKEVLTAVSGATVKEAKEILKDASKVTEEIAVVAGENEAIRREAKDGK